MHSWWKMKNHIFKNKKENQKLIIIIIIIIDQIEYKFKLAEISIINQSIKKIGFQT